MSMTLTTRDEEFIEIPSGIDTLNGFRRWAFSSRFPERGRISFLDGMVEIDMSPEEANSHVTLKGALQASMHALADDQGWGQVFSDGMLLINCEANIANEPDIMFCRWETMEAGLATLRESRPGNRRFLELHGSPESRRGDRQSLIRSERHEDSTARL